MADTAPERSSRRRSRRRTAKPRAQAKESKAKRVYAKPMRAQVVRAVKSPKTAPMSFRIDAETRDLVDHAAALAGQNRTDFMLTVLRERAIEIILNQRLFVLNDADWNAFVAGLDEAPAPNAKLKALLARVPIWDQ